MKNLNFKPECTNMLKNAKRHYVYAWVCAEWGNVYFYIGKGTGRRAFVTNDRSKNFTSILNNWTCYPVLLQDDLSEDDVYQVEYEMKKYYMFQRGYPIMDGEGILGLRAINAQIGRRLVKEKDPSASFGRPKKQINLNLLEDLYRKYCEKKMSISECCQILGISRGTWYYRIRNLCNENWS